MYKHFENPSLGYIYACINLFKSDYEIESTLAGFQNLKLIARLNSENFQNFEPKLLFSRETP